MSHETDHIRHLFQLYTSNQATDEQVRELFLFLEDPANDAFSQELVYNQMSEETGKDNTNSEIVWQYLQPKKRRTTRIWYWAAAAAVIIAVFIYRQPDKKPVVTAMDIPAATNKAVLKLADGSTIALDNSLKGTIAHQGKVSIIKSGNGELHYEGVDDQIMLNTVTTPMGGQYQLTLPDGTKAWLNAASSITYPAYFAGNDRQVTVTGEVYLEVAKDPLHPFIAGIPHHIGIQVLGTSFNVNAYADEENIKTTLIEGRISMIGSTVILMPGQQAIEGKNASLNILNNANIEKETAWKNGIFYFEDATLPLVMKQLERWYDIKVVYKGTIPALRINGKMDRNLTLQGVMDFLTKMDVAYTMEGRTIVVTGK